MDNMGYVAEYDSDGQTDRILTDIDRLTGCDGIRTVLALYMLSRVFTRFQQQQFHNSQLH